MALVRQLKTASFRPKSRYDICRPAVKVLIDFLAFLVQKLI